MSICPSQTINDVELEYQLERTRYCIEKIREYDAKMKVDVRQVRQEVGRMFDRTTRLSRTVHDVWDRNHVLEQKVKDSKHMEETNMKYRRILRHTRAQLAQTAILWNSTRTAFSADLSQAESLMVLLKSHLEVLRQPPPSLFDAATQTDCASLTLPTLSSSNEGDTPNGPLLFDETRLCSWKMTIDKLRIWHKDTLKKSATHSAF